MRDMHVIFIRFRFQPVLDEVPNSAWRLKIYPVLFDDASQPPVEFFGCLF